MINLCTGLFLPSRRNAQLALISRQIKTFVVNHSHGSVFSKSTWSEILVIKYEIRRNHIRTSCIATKNSPVRKSVREVYKLSVLMHYRMAVLTTFKWNWGIRIRRSTRSMPPVDRCHMRIRFVTPLVLFWFASKLNLYVAILAPTCGIH